MGAVAEPVVTLMPEDAARWAASNRHLSRSEAARRLPLRDQGEASRSGERPVERSQPGQYGVILTPDTLDGLRNAGSGGIRTERDDRVRAVTVWVPAPLPWWIGQGIDMRTAPILRNPELFPVAAGQLAGQSGRRAHHGS